MASIIKRKNKYAVVYWYEDDKGEKRQRWESFNTNAEAKKRKTEIEYQQETGELVIPEAKTISELLDEYMSIYGINTWAMSTYEARRSLISNYIKPIIGDMLIEDVTPRVIEKYYQSLLKVKSVCVNNRKPNNEYLSPHVVREVHKLLRCAFNQAVKWEMTKRNPCLNATLPKEDHKPRNIWDADTLFKAIDLCDDDMLKLAINLAFACSLRIGEMLGLTWDCIDIRDESIEAGKAYLFVNKELQRVNRDTMEKLNDKGVVLKFPAVFARNSTLLVLKEPKTATSVRKVYIPRTVAEMLKKRYEEIQELKTLFGDEFTDYNLVFCNVNGRPIEGSVINRAFCELIEKNGLPRVVFHSLRHSSITYKLKLNGGDIKSVQGDSGHAQSKMVSDVYSHIIDEDRRLNAERFETAFYTKDVETHEVELDSPVVPKPAPTVQDPAMIFQMLSNPEFLAAFSETMAKMNANK